MPAIANLLRIDLSNVIYLVFRLFPVFLVMFFVFSSIFAMDIKGFIYLAGLLFATLFAILTTNTIETYMGDSKKWWTVSIDDIDDKSKQNRVSRCEIISFNLQQKTEGEGTVAPTAPDERVSKVLPLSQIIYSYTFVYLIYIIGSYHLWSQNILTIMLLGLALISDWVWNYYNFCNTMLGIFLSFFLGGSFGVLWAYLIDSSGAVKLQYFSGLSNRTVCTRPDAQTYVCKDTR